MFGFLATLNLWDNPWVATQWGVVLGASLVAAFIDARTHRIPNKLTFPLLGSGLVWAGFAGGLVGVLEGAIACVVLATPFVLLFIGGAGGAGDAKLMGAIGAWLGILNGMLALVGVVVMGALLGLLYALMKGRFQEVLGQVQMLAVRLPLLTVPSQGISVSSASLTLDSKDDSLAMPYGVAIFCGVAVGTLGAYVCREFI